MTTRHRSLPGASQPDELAGGRWPRLGVAVLCAVQVVDVSSVSSATTAIPVIVADVDAPPSATALLAVCFAAAFGSFLIPAARFGDRFGHRGMLLVGLALFGGAATLAGISNGAALLVFARSLQGVAAALSAPNALRLILALTSPGRARRQALAGWGAAGAFGGVAGFLAGGILTQLVGWRAIFWLNTPLIAVLLVGIVWLVRPAAAGRSTARSVKIDPLGSVVLVAAVLALVGGASLLSDPLRWLPGTVGLVVGVLLVPLFWLRQRRGPHPLIPAGASRSVNLRTGAVLSAVNTACTSSTGVLVTLHLQQSLGASPLEAGLRLMPFSLTVIAGSFAARPLGDRLSERRLAAVGLLIIAAGNAALAVSGGSRAGMLVGVALAGIGLGIAALPATGIATSVVPELSGTAAGVASMAAQLGTAFGVAAAVSLANLIGGSAAGVVAAWTAVAALALVVAVWMALRTPRT